MPRRQLLPGEPRYQVWMRKSRSINEHEYIVADETIYGGAPLGVFLDKEHAQEMADELNKKVDE